MGKISINKFYFLLFKKKINKFNKIIYFSWRLKKGLERMIFTNFSHVAKLRYSFIIEIILSKLCANVQKLSDFFFRVY